MRELLRFMFFGDWNDFDSNAAGGRATLGFCWLFLLLALGSLVMAVVMAIKGVR